MLRIQVKGKQGREWPGVKGVYDIKHLWLTNKTIMINMARKTIIDTLVLYLGSGPKRFTEIKSYLESFRKGETPTKSYAKGTIQSILERASEYIEKTSRGLYELTDIGRRRLEELQEVSLEDVRAGKLTPQELERYLWKAADILRGAVEAPDYKHFILPMLFYKRLSDVYQEEYEELLKKYRDKEIARKKFHRFVIPEGCLWEDIRKVGKNVGEKLNDALSKIAKTNPELEGVVNRVDFNDQEKLSEGRLIKLIEHFSTLKLGNKNVDPDILGRAYEYLIKQFALAEARKGGEFYTPREVVRAMVEILGPDEGSEVYDSCVGSGGMLIESYYHLVRKGKNARNLFLYGQESTLFTWAIAKMNVILHNLEAEIRHGDTLIDPKFLENGGLKKFDIGITNPMWNQDGYRDVIENDKFGRFVYGTPPNGSADWGWIQHMLASLGGKGRMGIVLDQGGLFRGGSEGGIRKKVIEDDLIECVVALPEKIFYNTGAPGCLIFLNKNKPKDREDKVLFIHAANSYEKLKNMNRLREEDTERIVKAHKDFKDVQKFARVISREEIRKNDYNLSVARYVDIFGEEEKVDVKKVWQELNSLEKERQKINEKVRTDLKELGVE